MPLKITVMLIHGKPTSMNYHRAIAVQELYQKGIFTYCINLDPHANEYVSDIFGQQYTVIDDVEKTAAETARIIYQFNQIANLNMPPSLYT